MQGLPLFHAVFNVLLATLVMHVAFGEDRTCSGGVQAPCDSSASLLQASFKETSKVSSDKTRRENKAQEYIDITTPPHFDCEQEYATPRELVLDAHKWCNASFVPPEKRVPEFARGLYWMKMIGISDFAACTSLGEWDAETLTIKLMPWYTFAYYKTPDEKDDVPALMREVSAKSTNSLSIKAIGIGKNPLVYTFKYESDQLADGTITSGAPIFDFAMKHRIQEIEKTPDDEGISEQKGDIYKRDVWLLWRNGYHFTHYYLARMVYDNGTIHEGRIAYMDKEMETKAPAGSTFVRYGVSC